LWIAPNQSSELVEFSNNGVDATSLNSNGVEDYNRKADEELSTSIEPEVSSEQVRKITKVGPNNIIF
jgi:hypothetical protein